MRKKRKRKKQFEVSNKQSNGANRYDYVRTVYSVHILTETVRVGHNKRICDC